MKRSTKLILLTCIISVFGVTLLQLLWMRNYYGVNKERFEKDVNLAFEDAIKTEFRLRCDSVEQLILNYLTDTSKMTISSKWSNKFNEMIYVITDKKDTADKYSFSSKHLNKPILSQQDSAKYEVARQFALTFRETDLEHHIVYYRTQALGKYVSSKTNELTFDTTRLRSIYQKLLEERDIKEGFYFYLRHDDSSNNYSRFSDSLQSLYPIITKALPTFKAKEGENYIRALFHFPINYLWRKMTGMLIASLTLLAMISFVLFYQLSVIKREKRLSAIKNDFISNISHELKTPIATVTAAIDAMEGFGVLDNPVKTKRYLEISKNELLRLSDMVTKILNISIYERQDFELKPEPVNITDTVTEITNNYLLTSGKKLNFNFNNDTNTSVVKADKIHLHNVLNNLIDNAVKYSGESVHVTIHFYKDQDHFIIAVKDNGIGIGRNELPYIFDKFYRVPSGNIHAIKGYGLGLSYVKLIMEKHGGWCIAESKPGNGTTFKLGLPA